MRSGSSLLVLGALALVSVGNRDAAAQRLQPLVPPASAPRTQATPPAHDAIAPRSAHSLLTTLLYGAGGAVVGGWAGFMTSQIVWSDWQRVSRPGGVNRLHYTLTGAAIGALAGALIGHHSKPAAGPSSPFFGTRPAITTEQIEASHTRTVEELIQLLRPQWLNPRGNDIIQAVGSSALASVDPPATDVVRVYLDGEPLGGPQQLAEIPTPDALRVEYYDMKAATLRWGAGHTHGAINVITARGQH